LSECSDLNRITLSSVHCVGRRSRAIPFVEQEASKQMNFRIADLQPLTTRCSFHREIHAKPSPVLLRYVLCISARSSVSPWRWCTVDSCPCSSGYLKTIASIDVKNIFCFFYKSIKNMFYVFFYFLTFLKFIVMFFFIFKCFGVF